ncbi:hypothetical protein [Candidatus Blastococcus massiliensis]|uniref:hypothetical protein n=1 Tax=Candidatus Blastococcus massiliensis TaxID=1470358 RepID=UPI0012DC18BA|nr:hypothetical protein [Candidatus Blastococcus massiliensis]
MSVADQRSVTTSQATPRLPAVPPPPAQHVAPPPAPHRRTGRDGNRALAIGFAVVCLAGPFVEPMPTGDIHIPLWQIPIELATFASIVAATIALWRASRHAPRLVLAAGALLAVMTMVCPLAGHTPVGWWTWVQAGLSLAVMATGAALYRRGPATPSA